MKEYFTMPKMPMSFHAGLLVASGMVHAAEHCYASLFNRTVELDAQGHFQLNNVPAGISKARVRINCADSLGHVRSGYSEVFGLKASETYGVGPTHWDAAAPIPVRVLIRLDTAGTLGKGAKAHLWAQYPDSSCGLSPS